MAHRHWLRFARATGQLAAVLPRGAVVKTDAPGPPRAWRAAESRQAPRNSRLPDHWSWAAVDWKGERDWVAADALHRTGLMDRVGQMDQAPAGGRRVCGAGPGSAAGWRWQQPAGSPLLCDLGLAVAVVWDWLARAAVAVWGYSARVASAVWGPRAHLTAEAWGRLGRGVSAAWDQPDWLGVAARDSPVSEAAPGPAVERPCRRRLFAAHPDAEPATFGPKLLLASVEEVAVEPRCPSWRRPRFPACRRAVRSTAPSRSRPCRVLAPCCLLPFA